MKAITKGMCEVHIYIEYCDVDIDGDLDKGAVKWVRKQLSKGNEWAWCDVEVKVMFEGLEASDHLGACSYKSKQDFVTNSGYYDDMVDTCLDEINRKAEIIYTQLSA